MPRRDLEEPRTVPEAPGDENETLDGSDDAAPTVEARAVLLRIDPTTLVEARRDARPRPPSSVLLAPAFPPSAPPARDFAASNPPVVAAPSAGARILEDGTEDPSFGRYRLLSAIGTGGMAEILLALDEGAGLAKPCVIKRIARARTDDPEYRDRFREEGRIASRLRHPHVVSLYEYGEVDGVPFMALELVDGVDLDRLGRIAAGEGLPIRAILEIGVAVAEALSYAHSLTDEAGRGLEVVHRDVSPQNILVSREGRVKLADFGMARFEGRGFETGMGPSKGKLPYVAPEQLGFSRDVDQRADLYALAMVLSELIIGRPVAPEGPMVAGDVAGALGAALSAVPSRLRGLLMAMAHADPAGRPASAAEVVEILRAVLDDMTLGPGLLDYLEARVTPYLPSLERLVSQIVEEPLSIEALAPTPAYPTAALLAALPARHETVRVEPPTLEPATAPSLVIEREAPTARPASVRAAPRAGSLLWWLAAGLVFSFALLAALRAL